MDLIPGHIIPKTLKMVIAAHSLGTQLYEWEVAGSVLDRVIQKTLKMVLAALSLGTQLGIRTGQLNVSIM